MPGVITGILTILLVTLVSNQTWNELQLPLFVSDGGGQLPQADRIRIRRVRVEHKCEKLAHPNLEHPEHPGRRLGGRAHRRPCEYSLSVSHMILYVCSDGERIFVYTYIPFHYTPKHTESFFPTCRRRGWDLLVWTRCCWTPMRRIRCWPSRSRRSSPQRQTLPGPRTAWRAREHRYSNSPGAFTRTSHTRTPFSYSALLTCLYVFMYFTYEGAVAAGYELNIGSSTDFCAGELAPQLSGAAKLCITQVGL